MLSRLFRKKSFNVVLVFASADRTQVLPAALTVIKDSSSNPFESFASVSMKLVHRDSRVELDVPDNAQESAALLADHHVLMRSENPKDGSIEHYSHEEFDFIVIRPRSPWNEVEQMALPLKWQKALEPCGLRAILGGFDLHVTANQVRSMDSDAPFGYDIAGLTFCSATSESLQTIR